MIEPDPTSRLAGLRRLPARLRQTLRHTARTLANARQRARRWWQARSLPQQHLLIGVMLGVSINLLLHVAHHHLTWLQEIEDMTIDGIMRLQAATTATLTRPATPFVVLDIDEDTYRA